MPRFSKIRDRVLVLVKKFMDKMQIPYGLHEYGIDEFYIPIQYYIDREYGEDRFRIVCQSGSNVAKPSVEIQNQVGTATPLYIFWSSSQKMFYHDQTLARKLNGLWKECITNEKKKH